MTTSTSNGASTVRQFFLTTAVLAMVILAAPAVRSEDRSTLRWYRGNTHTHTINSDGNAAPDVVVRWYREHGYNFVVLTDHEFLTDVDTLNGVYGADERFLVMRGQEVTQWTHDPKRSAAHVNAINSKSVVYPVGTPECQGGGCGRHAPADMPLSETFAKNIAGILAADGIAQVNHPNYRWSVKAEDLFDIPDRTLLEIWNGIPDINNLGGTDDVGNFAPSAEGVWDVLLSRGRVTWGVGSDDSHDYFQFEDPSAARPGQAWIVVRAARLTPKAIATALAEGDFYASTGITLDDIVASSTEVAIRISGGAQTRPLGPRYLTKFIGRGGKILAEIPGTRPQYRIRGDEGYVRASIIDSNGRRAWTQPVFLDRKSSRLR